MKFGLLTILSGSLFSLPSFASLPFNVLPDGIYNFTCSQVSVTNIESRPIRRSLVSESGVTMVVSDYRSVRELTQSESVYSDGFKTKTTSIETTQYQQISKKIWKLDWEASFSDEWQAPGETLKETESLTSSGVWTQSYEAPFIVTLHSRRGDESIAKPSNMEGTFEKLDEATFRITQQQREPRTIAGTQLSNGTIIPTQTRMVFNRACTYKKIESQNKSESQK